jgi:hypothetical protein
MACGRQIDLRQQEEKQMAPLTAPTITIRPAYADDAQALTRLAVLDSAEVPAEPLLLAEADGELRAALSLADGSVIADPFAHTAQLVALLRKHAATVDSGLPRRRRVAQVAAAIRALGEGPGRRAAGLA